MKQLESHSIIIDSCDCCESQVPTSAEANQGTSFDPQFSNPNIVGEMLNSPFNALPGSFGGLPSTADLEAQFGAPGAWLPVQALNLPLLDSNSLSSCPMA
jgi:hypothetical protein